MCHHLQLMRKICFSDISELDLNPKCSVKFTEDFIVEIENRKAWYYMYHILIKGFCKRYKNLTRFCLITSGPYSLVVKASLGVVGRRFDSQCQRQ